MRKLKNYRGREGVKLMDDQRVRFMTVRLAAGMIRDGANPYGGEESIAVVGLASGRCWFENENTMVEEIE